MGIPGIYRITLQGHTLTSTIKSMAGIVRISGIMRILGKGGISGQASKFSVKGPGRIMGITGIYRITIQVSSFNSTKVWTE